MASFAPGVASFAPGDSYLRKRKDRPARKRKQMEKEKEHHRNARSRCKTNPAIRRMDHRAVALGALAERVARTRTRVLLAH